MRLRPWTSSSSGWEWLSGDQVLMACAGPRCKKGFHDEELTPTLFSFLAPPSPFHASETIDKRKEKTKPAKRKREEEGRERKKEGIALSSAPDYHFPLFPLTPFDIFMSKFCLPFVTFVILCSRPVLSSVLLLPFLPLPSSALLGWFLHSPFSHP